MIFVELRYVSYYYKYAQNTWAKVIIISITANRIIIKNTHYSQQASAKLVTKFKKFWVSQMSITKHALSYTKAKTNEQVRVQPSIL